MSETFHDGRVALHGGDCLDVLKAMADNSVDSVCTDPPYHLTSIVKRFGGDGAAECRDYEGGTGAYKRASRGFMGKQWDGGDIAFRPELWREVMRVLKPGGHVVAFAAPKNFDLMTAAIRAAGFEFRDAVFDLFSLTGLERRFVESLSPEQGEALARLLDHREAFGALGWCFGSGFPKSHDVSKAIDKAAGAERSKIIIPAAQVRNPKTTGGGRDGAEGATRPWIEAAMARGYHEAASDEAASDEAASDEAARWQGWGTALKPAIEPICLARKPLAEPSVAANVLKHGTGALHVDACRIGTAGGCAGAGAGGVVFGDGLNGKFGEPVPGLGRWPANVVHDGSAEALAAFPESAGGAGGGQSGKSSVGGVNTYGAGWNDGAGRAARATHDSGSAARFFYSAKADGDDRLGSKHPTVKPVDLMRWLVRLVTPPGGIVLDPFAGTGTTGEAALLEGLRAVLIEREPEYLADIARRMALVFAHARERKIAAVRHKRPKGGLTLFGDSDAADDVAEAARAPPDGDGAAVAGGASGPSMASSPCIGGNPPDRPHAMIEAAE